MLSDFNRVIFSGDKKNGSLAQLAEQGTLNAKVRGSSPWRVTLVIGRPLGGADYSALVIRVPLGGAGYNAPE